MESGPSSSTSVTNGRIVAPVWHNREVHRDFKSWSFRKKTMYDPGNYVDVGGHGALVAPGSFELRTTRKSHYHLGATSCAKHVNSEEPSSPIAFVDYDPEYRTMLIGEPLGSVIRRIPDSAESEKINVEGAVSLKVQDFSVNSVTTAVASVSEITVFRGSHMIAKQKLHERVDSYDLSPFIHTELITASRSCVTLANLTFESASNLITEDVSFFTHPRHVVVVHSDSVMHGDVRTPKSLSKIVDSNCLNLLPRNYFSSVKLNSRNVNQLFVLSSDCLSLWDVRYCTQPMGVFNHYVSRSSQLLGLQALPTKRNSLFILVRSSGESTLFEFDSGFSAPNASLLGPQLQLASPKDIGHYYWDQIGDQVPEATWKRLLQPVAGCCIIPEHDNDDGLYLHTFTTAGDWFKQKVSRREPEANGSGIAEKTFRFGLDACCLGEEQLQEVKQQVDKLKPSSTCKPSTGTPASVSVGLIFLEREPPSAINCPVCSNDIAFENAKFFCQNCNLGARASVLNDAWQEAGLIREAEDLTQEETDSVRELLGPNAGGLVVSNAIRAVWGEVDWRAVGETTTGATIGDANEPTDAEDNANEDEDDD